MNNPTRLLIASLLIVLMAGPAYPQNRETLQHFKDIIDLQQGLKQLQTSVDTNNALFKGLLERVADQMNTVSASLQKMNQTVDGIRTTNDATRKEFQTALKTLNDSIKELEGDVSSARSQINSISREMTTIRNAPEPLATPDDIWREANLNYNVGLWDLAISGLQEYLTKYPMDSKAAEAQLRIGDALMAQKKYDLAITQFDIVLQKYPESDTSRAALLKKGLAQADTNQPQAISTLNEVVKKFPGTTEAIAASAKVKELQSQRPKTPAR